MMESAVELRDKSAWVTGVISILLILVALIHGARCSVTLGGSAGIPTVHVTAADILIWIAFVLWLGHCIGHRHFRCFKEVPFAVCLLLLWTLLSAVPQLKGHAADFTVLKASALREFIKLFEIFVAAFLLYTVFARLDWMLHVVILALFVGASINLLMACHQYQYGQHTAMQISGLFSNRNTFAACLALVLPLLLGYSLWSRALLWRVWAGVLILASLFFVTAGGQFAAMVAGLILVAFFFRRFLALSIGLVVILLFALVLPHLRQDNSRLLFESVAPYRKVDSAGALKGALEKARTQSLARESTGTSIEPAPVNAPTASTESWPWQQRYQEWQAADNMIMASPFFGVGAGSYQANVNAFYQYEYGISLPPKYPGVNLMEEDALSMYSVWGASVGLPGLLFILLALIFFFRRAAKGFGNPDPHWRGIAAGGLGALVALCIAAVFTDFLVGGVGLTLAITLGLISASALRAKEAAQPPPQPAPAGND